MSFNPDKTKPSHKVVLSWKTKNVIYSNLHFSKVPIVKTISQKYLGLNLDEWLTFNNHINEKIGEAMKGVGQLRCNAFDYIKVCQLFINPS